MRSSLSYVATACSVLWILGCWDAQDPADVLEQPSQQMVRCRADVRASTVSCARTTLDQSPVAPLFDIIGGQGVYILLTSSNVSYDNVAEVFSADVTVQNLMSRTLGTPDGSTVTGIRVFFHSGPNVTSGTGTVAVRNPDGTGSFTASNQPYHEYVEMLGTDETTAPKNWEWDVPSSVLTFAFEVYVEADRANLAPTATISAPPDSAAYEIGATVTFSGSGTDPEDGALTGDALVWTSSAEFGQQIGTGESFSRDDLRAGMHRVVLTAADSDGATATDTVQITVHGVPVPGLWQVANAFGGFAFEVNPASTGITEITYYLDEFQCGLQTWQGFGSEGAEDPGWPITAGHFSIENGLAVGLRMTVEGFFQSSEFAGTWWEMISGGTHCVEAWPPVQSARPATRLFLRYDGTRAFLSREPSPPGEDWIARYPGADSYSNGTMYEWPADLDLDLDGKIYTFAAVLRADTLGTSGGDFLFRVWVDHDGTESNLASNRFEVPAGEERRDAAAATDEGTISGGVAGDRLMVRVTYWGGDPGELYFGYLNPTHVIVPGHVTVSEAAGPVTSPHMNAITAVREPTDRNPRVGAYRDRSPR